MILIAIYLQTEINTEWMLAHIKWQNTQLWMSLNGRLSVQYDSLLWTHDPLCTIHNSNLFWVQFGCVYNSFEIDSLTLSFLLAWCVYCFIQMSRWTAMITWWPLKNDLFTDASIIAHICLYKCIYILRSNVLSTSKVKRLVHETSNK